MMIHQEHVKELTVSVYSQLIGQIKPTKAQLQHSYSPLALLTLPIPLLQATAAKWVVPRFSNV